jgi:predicted nuclease with RNAse H fold
MKRKKFYIGIDLGGKEKRTTGICILDSNPPTAREKIILAKDVLGKNLFKVINPYLENTKVIAIDAPLTKGRGKGKMRLYEKFLSTSIFRKERVAPIPPALMKEFRNFALEVTEKLEKRGFILGINLIETFPTLVKKISRGTFCPKNQSLQGENQKSAFICARIAFLHSQFKTRWLGYKDGFLFLPEFSFWKKEWQQKFYQAWKALPRLKYHHLITNLFS